MQIPNIHIASVGQIRIEGSEPIASWNEYWNAQDSSSMKPSWTGSGALGPVSLGTSTGSGTAQMPWAPPVSPELSPPSVLWVEFPRLQLHCYQLGKAGPARLWRRSWGGDWLGNGVMQKLPEGSLESPALKETADPKAAVPKTRHSFQADAALVFCVHSGGDWSLQSLALCCTVKRETSK